MYSKGIGGPYRGLLMASIHGRGTPAETSVACLGFSGKKPVWLPYCCTLLLRLDHNLCLEQRPQETLNSFGNFRSRSPSNPHQTHSFRTGNNTGYGCSCGLTMDMICVRNPLDEVWGQFGKSFCHSNHQDRPALPL